MMQTETTSTRTQQSGDSPLPENLNDVILLRDHNTTDTNQDILSSILTRNSSTSGTDFLMLTTNIISLETKPFLQENL